MKNGSIEPRVTALEIGQENLQKELMNLTVVVKEQGLQLTSAISKLIETHNDSVADLLERLNSFAKTDWTTFWTMIGSIVLILGAISTPIWLNFGYLNKELEETNIHISKSDIIALDSIKNNSILSAKVESLEKQMDKVHQVFFGKEPITKDVKDLQSHTAKLR